MASKQKAPVAATKRSADDAVIRATDDVEGHASKQKAPTAATKRAVDDVEGHASKQKAPTAATTRAGDESEDDVEGHNFGQNAMLSSNAAQTREREVQRNLKKHDLKSEARRPFFKRGS